MHPAAKVGNTYSHPLPKHRIYQAATRVSTVVVFIVLLAWSLSGLREL